MPTVRVHRTIAAAPERVYRAWLDPDVMVRWFAPREFQVGRVEIDARVGGRVSIWHRDDETDVGGAEAEIVELVPHELIVFRWWFVGPERDVDPNQETRLTIHFAPDGSDNTLVTVVHDQLDGLGEVMPEVSANVENGWAGALEALASELEK